VGCKTSAGPARPWCIKLPLLTTVERDIILNLTVADWGLDTSCRVCEPIARQIGRSDSTKPQLIEHRLDSIVAIANTPEPIARREQEEEK